MARRKTRRQRPDAKGRSERGQFWSVGYPFLHSIAWRSLTGPAVKIFIELRSRFHGGNNGRLRLSYREAAKLLHLSYTTTKRAFGELQDKGFIKLRAGGSWYGRKAHEWIVTDMPYENGNGQQIDATREWKDWKPRPDPAGPKTEIATPAVPS